ncbi:LacI family DNA-binding transcriptional regulator [Streptomyces sp. NPDC085931]|uniref:LacI family DNA-binding transcriptional regulator n=1 Tax=Streptomyces sp. NPDC085931 TaxID=3365740 RepID=UPI0037D77823
MARITDVARRAGVSPSTVSYALSGKRPISAETRRRVEEAARELGYRPQPVPPAHGAPNVLAVAAPLRPGVHLPALMRLTQSVVTAARGYDHDVLLLTGEEGLSRSAVPAPARVLLVVDVGLHDPRLPVLRSLGRPAVLIGLPAERPGLPCVDLDYRAAGEVCVHHLAALGHRAVALLGPPPEVYVRETASARRLVEGFTAAADRHRMASSVHPAECSGAPALVDRLLGAHPAPTAVIVQNDALVVPLLTALRQRGRRIPEDMSVLAVGTDVPETVSAVTVPSAELGTLGVELLLRERTGPPVPRTTLLPPRLTERGSTGRA